MRFEPPRNSDHPKYQLLGALWGIFWSLVIAGILWFILTALGVI